MDTIRESTYNQSDGKGGYTDVEPDYALAPGKTSVYAVTVIVPSDWPSGDKKVLFVASDGQLAPDSALSSQAENELKAVEFHVEPGTYKVVQQRTSAEQDSEQRHMDTLTVTPTVAGGMYFQSAPTRGTSKMDTGGPGGSRNGDSSNGSKNASSSSTSTRNATPHTGDITPMAGLGLATVGAALVAYEHRRAKNE